MGVVKRGEIPRTFTVNSFFYLFVEFFLSCFLSWLLMNNEASVSIYLEEDGEVESKPAGAVPKIHIEQMAA